MSVINTIPIKNCVDVIINQIANKKLSINNRQLLRICEGSTDFFSNKTDPHLHHEIAETAINYLIKQNYARELLKSSNPSEKLRQTLIPLIDRLPTQTWRSKEQILKQQFSTPPHIAYFLTYLLNLNTNEIVLEPSAGTGGLAVWADGLGLKTFTNEIDTRRRKLLNTLGFNPTSFNAEYINDFLSPKIKPDVLLMNPPFSSSGGKTKNNSSKFGFRHVSSALERLKSGGKFGIILGNSASLEKPTGRKFWQEMLSRIILKAIIKIDGREYTKYGTSVNVHIFIGTKYLKFTENSKKVALNAIPNISIRSIEEGFDIAQSSNLLLD